MPLPDNPTITVTFDGLLLLFFGKNKSFCQIGLLEPDELHCLKITGKTKPSGKPIKFPKKIDGDVVIEAPGRDGVNTYESKKGEDRQNDFHWLVDLEGKDFYNRKLEINRDGIHQSLFFYKGLFYTVKKQRVRVFHGGKFEREEDVARIIGCNLYLKEGERAILRYGLRSKESIEFPYEPGVSYSIRFSTICPGRPGDFKRYYEVVKVKPKDQYDIRGSANNPGRPVPRGEGRLPCNPARLSKTKAPI